MGFSTLVQTYKLTFILTICATCLTLAALIWPYWVVDNTHQVYVGFTRRCTIDSSSGTRVCSSFPYSGPRFPDFYVPPEESIEGDDLDKAAWQTADFATWITVVLQLGTSIAYSSTIIGDRYFAETAWRVISCFAAGSVIFQFISLLVVYLLVSKHSSAEFFSNGLSNGGDTDAGESKWGSMKSQPTVLSQFRFGVGFSWKIAFLSFLIMILCILLLVVVGYSNPPTHEFTLNDYMQIKDDYDDDDDDDDDDENYTDAEDEEDEEEEESRLNYGSFKVDSNYKGYNSYTGYNGWNRYLNDEEYRKKAKEDYQNYTTYVPIGEFPKEEEEENTYGGESDDLFEPLVPNNTTEPNQNGFDRDNSQLYDLSRLKNKTNKTTSTSAAHQANKVNVPDAPSIYLSGKGVATSLQNQKEIPSNPSPQEQEETHLLASSFNNNTNNYGTSLTLPSEQPPNTSISEEPRPYFNSVTSLSNDPTSSKLHLKLKQSDITSEINGESPDQPNSDQKHSHSCTTINTLLSASSNHIDSSPASVDTSLSSPQLYKKSSNGSSNFSLGILGNFLGWQRGSSLGVTQSRNPNSHSIPNLNSTTKLDSQKTVLPLHHSYPNFSNLHTASPKTDTFSEPGYDDSSLLNLSTVLNMKIPTPSSSKHKKRRRKRYSHATTGGVPITGDHASAAYDTESRDFYLYLQRTMIENQLKEREEMVYRKLGGGSKSGQK